MVKCHGQLNKVTTRLPDEKKRNQHILVTNKKLQFDFLPKQMKSEKESLD